MLGANFTLTQSYSENREEERKDDFRNRLSQIASHGLLSLAISLGIELKLFDALAKAGSSSHPATAQEVAMLSRTKHRYVQEWLNCMACGEIIEVDPSGQQFWIADEKRNILVGDHDHQRDKSFLFNQIIPIFGGGIYRKMLSIFKVDGPLGLELDDFDEHNFAEKYGHYSRTFYGQYLIKDFIPLLGGGGVEDLLKQGISVLDVGCGVGFHLLQLANLFPQSKFAGVDLAPEAIRVAQRDAQVKKLSNVTFIFGDVTAMDAGWTNCFDLVFNFEALHELERPDVALVEVHRVLKEGGLFAMVEVNGTGNCHSDKNKFGAADAAYFYACSLFHSLPLSSNSKGALQLGTMWTAEKGKKLLEQAGFPHDSITTNSIPSFPAKVLYQARK